MRDYLSIGSCPADESCAQIGEIDYHERSQTECQQFIYQLRRQFGPEPANAQLKIKSFPHDFGSYREVVCYFDDADEAAIEYAFKLENECPAEWDGVARAKLGLTDDRSHQFHTSLFGTVWCDTCNSPYCDLL